MKVLQLFRNNLQKIHIQVLAIMMNLNLTKNKIKKSLKNQHLKKLNQKIKS